MNETAHEADRLIEAGHPFGVLLRWHRLALFGYSSMQSDTWQFGDGEAGDTEGNGFGSGFWIGGMGSLRHGWGGGSIGALDGDGGFSQRPGSGELDQPESGPAVSALPGAPE